MDNPFRDILIHVRDFKTHTPAARFGVQVAKAWNSAVTGVFVCPEPLYMTAGYGGWITDSMVEEERQLVSDAMVAGPVFREWVLQQGIVCGDWLVAEAVLDNALVQASMRYDLLVLDRDERHDNVSVNELSRVVLSTLTPCLVVPRDAGAFKGFGRIAVAWNGSPEAMRALHSALPLLRGHRVLLMRGEERALGYRADWHPPLDIVKYLTARDVQVDEQEIRADRGDVGAVLLNAAAAYGADLLVMGAFGRTRFSEWILGGATRDVLSDAPIPVWVRH